MQEYNSRYELEAQCLLEPLVIFFVEQAFREMPSSSDCDYLRVNSDRNEG